MSNIDNFVFCEKCGSYLIAEESEAHKIRHGKVKDVVVVNHVVWVDDGLFYPLRLSPTKMKHDFRPTEDGTEPRIVMKIIKSNKSLMIS